MKKRIAVFVSGGGTNLQALIDAQKSGIINSGEIAVVISSKPDVYALKRAESANIPTAVVSRKTCNSQEEFEQGIIRVLDEYMIDFIILAGFMSILSEDFTKDYPERILNVHPSLIPSFCGKGFYGLHVHEEVLKRGVKLTGATVHFVDAGTDTGPIIMQKAVEVLDDDTPEVLQRRVMEQAEWKIMPEAINLIANGLVTVVDNKVKIKR